MILNEYYSIEKVLLYIQLFSRLHIKMKQVIMDWYIPKILFQQYTKQNYLKKEETITELTAVGTNGAAGEYSFHPFLPAY